MSIVIDKWINEFIAGNPSKWDISKFNSASDFVIIAQEFATLEGKFKSLIP